MQHITEQQLQNIKERINMYNAGLCTLTNVIGEVLDYGFEVQSNYNNNWKLVKQLPDKVDGFPMCAVIDLQTLKEEIY